MEKRENTAILLLYCPDQQGIITEITRFIADNRGNIVYLDQYVDRHDGVFFMRIEWELEGFTIPRDKINDYIDTLYAKRYGMTYYLYFTDQKPRMALFVSKMSHCLYDLFALTYSCLFMFGSTNILELSKATKLTQNSLFSKFIVLFFG